jgi:hypothetical protein
MLLYILTGATLSAQDYSNKGLMELKELSEAKRMAWMKAFDDAVQSQTFANLPPVRQDNESFLDRHISALRRMYAEGDARGLLNSVANYLQIQRQFVKDVMMPAESLTPSNTVGIENINSKIAAFADKEKTFLVDINNALLLEPNEVPPPPPPTDETADEGEEMEEMRGSVVEERTKKRKGKLPHEQGGKDKRKGSKKEETE